MSPGSTRPEESSAIPDFPSSGSVTVSGGINPPCNTLASRNWLLLAEKSLYYRVGLTKYKRPENKGLLLSLSTI
jgi:hypothetical protein